MEGADLSIAAVSAAWRFLGTAWKRAWAAMLIGAALFGAPWALDLWSPRSPWRLAALLAVVAAAAMIEGALYRVALSKGRPGPAGLQWGGPEWRLGVVWGLTAAFLSVLGMLAFVAVFFSTLGLAMSGPGFVLAAPETWAAAVVGPRRIVAAVVTALCLGGLVWAGARIALGGAASVDRGKVQLLATWPATRRLVTPILVGRVLLGIVPIGFACGVLRAVGSGGHWSATLVWTGSLAAGVAVTGVWLPLSVGLMAYLYSRLPASP